MAPYLSANFYRFVALPDAAQRREALLALCRKERVQGLILLASEGINGSIAGAPEAVRNVLAWLRQDPLLAPLEHKESWSEKAPFRRMQVRLKAEIVTLRVPGISPTHAAGEYVPAAQWNALLRSPDLLLIDTRNDYEVELGSFAGALNPQLRNFAELPAWLDAHPLIGSAARAGGAQARVAMFCTGGIRCEKSTAYLRSRGLQQVYHLQGGILEYLEEVSPQDSLWRGECFVFDERVSLGHGLRPGPHQLCRACRQPLPEGAMESPLFELGVSCPRCHASSSAAQKSGARERQRQWERAKARLT